MSPSSPNRFMVVNSPLLSFLRGEGRGPRDATLAEVLAMDFEGWQTAHDFIQWVFPTDQPSRFVKESPLLTPELQAVARGDERILANTRRSFEYFLDFLGLELVRIDDEGQPNMRIRRSPQFGNRRTVCWEVNCLEGNHNWRRISRALRSLSLLGLDTEVAAFYRCLESMWVRGDIIPPQFKATVEHWRQSAGVEGELAEQRGRFGGCLGCSFR